MVCVQRPPSPHCFNSILNVSFSLAFRDINPQGPVHFLVIPKDKEGLNRLSSATEAHIHKLGHLMFAAQKVAHAEGLVPGGFRVVVNDGSDGAQRYCAALSQSYVFFVDFDLFFEFDNE